MKTGRSIHDFWKLIRDFLGLRRICGLSVSTRWLLCIVAAFAEVVKRGDLQPADRMMGEGPFKIRLGSRVSEFSVLGAGIITGIREMYVRDCYLQGGALNISDGDVVLDLGSNVGNFTTLALAHGPTVKVIAVEPSSAMNDAFCRSVGMNEGFAERVQLIRAFVGERTEKQRILVASHHHYSDTPWLTECELINLAELKNIDFLKCDIEGGEYGLLSGDSRILKMTKNLAMEVHAFGGDVGWALCRLEELGLSTCRVTWDQGGSCTVLAARRHGAQRLRSLGHPYSKMRSN
jgi:FkbM family methyltransferase